MPATNKMILRGKRTFAKNIENRANFELNIEKHHQMIMNPLMALLFG